MQIQYSPHAKKRLLERNIHKAEVILTLTKPDNKAYIERNRIIANKQFKSYTSEVVYVVEEKRIVIITLYYLWQSHYKKLNMIKP